MKINNDLVDAVMMLSFICLVLVGTTSFESEVTKDITMGALGGITILMVVLRGLGFRHKKEEEETTFN